MRLFFIDSLLIFISIAFPSSSFLLLSNRFVSSTRILTMSDKNSIFYQAVNHKEYPDDDYSHVLGYGDPDHKLSRLQEICRIRLQDIAQDKKPIDTVSDLHPRHDL
jgi:hypothetical protein